MEPRGALSVPAFRTLWAAGLISDGGDWLLVAPAGNISDDRTESYQFTVQHLSVGEHTLAVRAYDRYDNIGAGKIVIVVK